MAEQIIVEYKVELGNLKAKLSELEKQLNKTGETAKKAGKETSNSLSGIGKIGQSLDDQFKELGKGLVAAFAVTEVINFGKESIKAFQEAELNATKLKFALINIGKEGGAAYEKLINQSAELQDISIFSDDDIQRAQTQLVQFGLTADEVEKLIPKILDLASATGTDLGQATDTVIMGVNGVTRGLKPLGLEFTNTGDKAQNLAIISDKLNKYQGQTKAILETSSGAWKRWANIIDDSKETVGGFLLTYLDEFSAFGQIIGGIFDKITGKTKELTGEKGKSFLEKYAEASEEGKKKLVEQQLGTIKVLEETNKLFDIKTSKDVSATLKKISNGIAEAQRLRDELDAALNPQKGGLGKTEEQLAKEQAAKDAAAAKEKAAQEKLAADLLAAFEALKNKEIELTNAANIQLAQSEIDKVNIASEATAAELSLLYDKTDKGLAATEEYNLAILANDKATDEKIRQIQKKKWEEEQANREKDLKAADDGFAEFKALFIKNNADLKTINKKAAEDKQTLRDQELQASNDILTALGDANNAALNVELANLQEQLDKKQITQEQFDQKTRAAKRAAAENDRNLQIYSITINTAAAIVKMLADPGGFAGVGLSIAAGIAGLAQLALVASQPLPAFAAGTDFVGLGKNRRGKDTIPALLNEGEAIIPTDQNAQYPGLSKAWINGSLDKYILSNFVAPAINEHRKKIDAKNSESFASEIAKAILINQRGFNDKNLVDSDVKTREILRLQSKYLKNMASSLSDSNAKIIRKRGWNV